MIRPFTRAAACGSLLALSACGGGSGGEGEAQLEIGSKADALRELGVVLSVTRDLPDPLPPVAAAPVAKQIGGEADLGRANGSCGSAGNSTVSPPDTKPRSFSLLSGQSVNVGFQFEVSNACFSLAEAPSPRTATLRYNGRFEIGESQVQGDGSQLGYIVDGTASNLYSAIYEQRLNGQAVERTTQLRAGRLEKRIAAGGAVDLHALYGYSFQHETLEGGRTVSSRVHVVNLGLDNTPFRQHEDGDELSLNGPYEYSSAECSGGTVTVTTEEVLKLDAQDRPVDGKLRLAAGSQFAVLEFNSDGGASLNLNGNIEALTAAEVRAMADESPC